MVTKSRLFGGADTWSPNGAIPWGRNYENSLAWYADAGVFLTPMYAYEMAAEGLTHRAAIQGFGHDESLVEPLSMSAAIDEILLKSIVEYIEYETPAEGFTLGAPVISEIEVEDLIKFATYDKWTPELITISSGVTEISLAQVVVTYQIPSESIALATDITEITLL